MLRTVLPGSGPLKPNESFEQQRRTSFPPILHPNILNKSTVTTSSMNHICTPTRSHTTPVIRNAASQPRAPLKKVTSLINLEERPVYPTLTTNLAANLKSSKRVKFKISEVNGKKISPLKRKKTDGQVRSLGKKKSEGQAGRILTRKTSEPAAKEVIVLSDDSDVVEAPQRIIYHEREVPVDPKKVRFDGICYDVLELFFMSY